MKKTFDWKQLLPDWLLLFGTAWTTMACLQAAYELTASPGLWIWILLLTGLLCVLFRLPKPWIAALAVLGLGLVGMWVFRTPLKWSLWQLWQTVLSRLSPLYGWVSEHFVLDPTIRTFDLTPALVLLSGVLVYFLCLFTVWLRSTMPAVLMAVLFVTPCFFLTDMLDGPPATVLLVALCGCVLALIFSGGVQRRSPQEGWKASLWALLPTGLLIGLLLLLFPRENYKPPITFDRLNRKIEELGQQINGDTPATGSSLRRNVELRSLGQKTQRTFTVLELSSTGDPWEYLYLRGTAYEGFDGDRWQLVDPPTWDGEGSPFDARINLSDPLYLQLRAVQTQALLYVPQNVVAVPYDTVFDYYVPNGARLDEYGFAYYPPYLRWKDFDFYGENGSDPGGVYVNDNPNDALQPLRDDAYAHCLELPDDTRDALTALAAAQGITPVQNNLYFDQADTISRILYYVRDGADYTLRPAAVPDGENFCTWFLDEGPDGGGKDGYCVHYATVTAALCRAMGIPARYVEGFVTALTEETDENGNTVYTANVQERQSHAWVETWSDDLGWRRCDPTPSDGIADSAAPRSGNEEGTRPTEAPETSEPDASRPVKPFETDPSEAATEPTESATEAPTVPEPTEEQKNGPGVLQDGRLWRLLGILTIPLLLWLLRGVLRRQRRKKAHALRGNALALWRWQRYRRLCRAVRWTPDEKILALAQKARFSQYTLNDAELGRLGGAVHAAEAAVRYLPLPKRLWYSYWLL